MKGSITFRLQLQNRDCRANKPLTYVRYAKVHQLSLDTLRITTSILMRSLSDCKGLKQYKEEQFSDLRRVT